MIDAYFKLIDLALKNGSGPLLSSPYERYYDVGAEIVDRKTVVGVLSAELHKRGLIASPEARSIPADTDVPFKRYDILVSSWKRRQIPI